jgi:TolB-like protein
MSFFSELKRRNVFRVGIAYTVVAWLVAQVVDLVLESFGTPPWVMKSLLVILAAGLPLAIVFAWAFEMTPEGIKKEKDVDRSQSITSSTGRKLDRMIIGIMAVVIAFLVLDRFVLTNESEEPVSESDSQTFAVETETAPAEAGPSVAVLPFVNMSGDADNEYFSDGLTETLLHMLAQLPELRVAARTSSFAFKGQNAGIAEISEALKVAHILEGSVQKAGNRVRVTAQLIRADDGFHVWSQNYDRTLEDIFAIQDEIAEDVAGALDATLLGGNVKIAHIETSDVGAYDTYLRAMEQQAIGSYGSLSSAESLLKHALAADPGFIDAKLSLAQNYLLQFDTGLIEEAQMQQGIMPLLSQVRELQPENRLARAIEISTQYHPGTLTNQDELRVVADELRMLSASLPSETFLRDYTARMIAFGLNQPEAALDIIEAGFMFDPLSAELYATKGNIFSKMKRFEDARVSFLKAVELAPLDPNHYSRMSVVSADLGDIAGIFVWRLKNIQADPQDHEIAGHMAREFYEWGLPEEGDRWMKTVSALAPNSDILQRLRIDRSLSRGDSTELIRVAQQMIAAPASMRHDVFPTALFSYRQHMSQVGNYQEAYDFLAGLRPEIKSFEQLPGDLHGVLMQWASIELMSGFKSPEERKEAWGKFARNLREHGSWWFDEPNAQSIDFLFMGDLDSAVQKAQEDLAQPLSSWPTRGDSWNDPIFAAITTDPEISARLSELDREKQQVRGRIREILRGPEWNQ